MRASLLFAACVFAVAVSASVEPKAPANFTGYIVTAQWDGRTIPSPQWALDVTRQDTSYRFQQELKLANLIPTTAGDALIPTYTAYEPSTRSYFLTTQRNQEVASLWGFDLASDVGSASPLNSEVRFTYPESGASLVGIQAFATSAEKKAEGAPAITVLAFFNTLTGNCTVMNVNYQTGASTFWANLCNNYTRELTTAIEADHDNGVLYILTQALEGAPDREIVTLNVNTGAYSAVTVQPLINHDPTQKAGFEMTWIASLNNLLVFYTGAFDQLIWTSPASGATSFAIFDLAEYQGSEGGNLEFTENDYLEDDDTWTDSAFDVTTGKLYFQCSDVDPDSGLATTALCQIQIPPKAQALDYVNIAIEPMTYGYAGMQYVQVVA